MNKKFAPLSNFELDDLMKGYKNYRGTFSRDTLPTKIKPNDMGIINLDSITGPGTHWTCYFNSPKTDYVYYFDSFGMPPPEEVKKFLKTSKKQVMYNTSEIQKISSIMCGYYCIHMLQELSKGEDFYDAIYTFDPWPSSSNESEIKLLSKIL